MTTKQKQALIDRFNKRFPVGSKVHWRSTRSEPFKEMTVQFAAYDLHGMPVAFFAEKSGCCSIDPMFVDYDSKANV